MKLHLILILTFILLINSKRSKYPVYLLKKNYQNVSLPVVIWHGMGDSCCNPLSIGWIKSIIQKQLPGVYVHSLMIGDNVASDTEHGFIGNMNFLVEEACEKIRKDPYLRNGYNGLGFSQGGLFMRAVAERCPTPQMNNLISIGGPQQGIYGFPYCVGPTRLCRYVKTLLNYGAYTGFVQRNVVQAQYWHDPKQDDEYKTYNIFLADLNNENEINKKYKENLLKLKKMVLVKFLRDEMVVPKESEWFGFYDKSGVKVIPMENTTLYSDDKLGLKKLSDSGRMYLLECDGQHLQMSEDFFINKIIFPFLK
uniref:Palmitoyl-protein thioesterase 1 n=1 Tax=Parastrongyloides trichosuri TaxID=131310 RepID=A0A0N4ZPF7_PARTI